MKVIKNYVIVLLKNNDDISKLIDFFNKRKEFAGSIVSVELHTFKVLCKIKKEKECIEALSKEPFVDYATYFFENFCKEDYENQPVQSTIP